MKKIILFSALALAFIACRKDTKTEEPEPTPVTNDCPPSGCVHPQSEFVPTGSGPFLKFKFKFDSAQARLNGFGVPTPVASGNAGYSPVMNGMSAHYIELAQNDFTQVGSGVVLYKANETTCGGSKAIVYCQSVVVKDSVFFAIPFSQIPPGSYKWLRVSLAYQNYDIPFLITATTGSVTQWGTIASFLGFNTYITQYAIKNMTVSPTATLGGQGNHKQGYWGFEYMGQHFDGQPPAGATTVVNPNPNSLIPPGSCLVTGEFYNTGTSSNSPFVITGTETTDKVIFVSLSTNKSFEWKENPGGTAGYYEPMASEFPVDMGTRGMMAKYD